MLKTFAVCTVYRPPDTPLSCFDSDLATSLTYVMALDQPIYILGDFNCDLLNDQCQASKTLKSFYRSFNLSQLINAPTRVTLSSTSLLDIVLVSDITLIEKANVMCSSISNHDLIYGLRLRNLRLRKPRKKRFLLREVLNIINRTNFQRCVLSSLVDRRRFY
jgi:hypothetical protein